MRPNSQRAKNAKTLLYLVMGATILSVIGKIFSIITIRDTILNGGPVENNLQEVVIIGLVVSVFSLIYVAVYVLAIVFFIQWFRRAYFNLHNLVSSSKLSYSEGWAAGAWFVPVLNLFGPYQIATDLFSKSEELLISKGLMERKKQYHQVKGWWWAIWISSGVIAGITRNLEDQMGFDMPLLVVFSVLRILSTIASGILAIRMIDNYSKMEVLLKQIPVEDGERPQILITNDDLLDSGI